MKDEQILSGLVCLREHCKTLVHSFLAHAPHEPGGTRRPAAGRLSLLERASGILDEIRTCLRSLPPKPYLTVSVPRDREHASRLLREIGDLAERVVVVERESRLLATARKEHGE